MAGIFLDDVAELARAHHASSARTSLRCYIREHSPSRHLDLSLCGQKWVCLTESPSPTSPNRDCVNQLFSSFASVSFSFFKIALSLRSEAPARGVSCTSVTFFCELLTTVIYRAKTNIQWKEGSSLGGRPLKPQNICPFKGISSWYAQNPLQGCQRLTGSQRAGMSVKTELRRGGVRKLFPAPTQQYSQSQMIPPDYGRGQSGKVSLLILANSTFRMLNRLSFEDCACAFQAIYVL